MVHALAAFLATALAAALVLVQPWAGRRRYRRLLAAVKVAPSARVRHYRRGIIGEWTVVGIVVVIGLLAGRSGSAISLNGWRNSGTWGPEVVEIIVLLGVTAVIFHYGRAKVREVLRRQAKGFLALLPRTNQERAAFVGLAVTAGVCEEIIFRGFGFAYVRWLWPAAPEVAVVALTSVAFGFAHLYQGLRGVILTGVVGAVLAWLVFSAGSLVPAMVVHALLDLRVLALPDLDDVPQPAPPAPDPA